MTVFEVFLILATVLCSLVAGFLFAFATVVMPGIKSLDDGSFIRAFQAIDGVIQKGAPRFWLRVGRFGAVSGRGGGDGGVEARWIRSVARDWCRARVSARCASANNHDKHPPEQSAPET